MADYTLNVGCTACGGMLTVELRRMRLNLPNACPGCGSWHRISEDEAIKAHRLLEELELEGGISNVV